MYVLSFDHLVKGNVKCHVNCDKLYDDLVSPCNTPAHTNPHCTLCTHINDAHTFV